MSAKGPTPFKAIKLEVYGDSDLGGTEGKESTYGYLVLANNHVWQVIDWKSKRIGTICTSTTEAELCAMFHAVKQGVYLKRFFNDAVPKS